MDMAPRLLNVAYQEYPVAAGATACLGQFEVSSSRTPDAKTW